MSAIARSSSDKPSEKKIQKPEEKEIDGCEDKKSTAAPSASRSSSRIRRRRRKSQGSSQFNMAVRHAFLYAKKTNTRRVKPVVNNEDGWHDDLDEVYDWRADEVILDSISSVFKVQGWDFKIFHYYKSIWETRGFDAKVDVYEDRNRCLVDESLLDYEELIKLIREGAQHALNFYNDLKGKSLVFVNVVKTIIYFSIDHLEYCYITFEAEEKGNQVSRKLYQTRVLVQFPYTIAQVCSFRPKP